ncbi:putative E3 ubiquitin ligase complex SCF subunit scon-2 [Madurella mycetomatis]|uniref:E3 ubiquitin ligase complex SCF subunit scon-2 n=1 Tax=Madurella mycetomatis TaxID=100816 RepID=A0A175W756_9PEZI|nr:putative E3 ubiquitin ligase complex SCF subunit scon-2 [Madurella mycetomatis]
MEGLRPPTVVHDRPPLPRQHGIDLSPDDADPALLIDRLARPLKSTSAPVRNSEGEAKEGVDTTKTCNRLRPEEKERLRSRDSMPNMSSSLIGKTVTPFLKEHIPRLYAPIGKPQNQETAREKDPNTKYCYRHRPDSKCRRAADEAKMVMIQRELDKLTPADQQAITHVWSLFSAAPARHRNLMLQGVLSQLCFPQLSLVSREVSEALKIDFITALPVELSQKILCYLDTVSLTKAAQVSQRWRQLADDDAVWVRMCEQHVNRKCIKCGWGLPLLERKKLRNYTRQRQLAKGNSNGRVQESDPPARAAELGPQALGKRQGRSTDDGPDGKRRCLDTQQEQEPKTRSWKAVYRDRWQVGYNWKYGRCTVKTLKGHTNGVTCLQLDDHILATGSYDATIKIWNIETGEEIRTLQGHTRGIRALQFDDSKLISGSLDNTIKIWNWHTGECISTLQGHSDGVVSVHFDAQLLASGSIDRSVKIFDFNSKEAFCLKGHSDWVNCTRLDINSRTVMSSSDDTTIKLWDLDTKQVIRTFEGHIGHVQQVLLLPPEYEPDDELLAGVNESGDNTDTISVSSGREGPLSVSLMHSERRSSSPSCDNEIRSLYGSSFASDTSRPLPPRYFLSGGLDSTIRLWDSATGKCLKTMFGHLEGVWTLAGDTIRVISGANDGMVKCWEPRSGKCDATFVGHRGPVTCVGLSDSRMASGSEDGEESEFIYVLKNGWERDVGVATGGGVG